MANKAKHLRKYKASIIVRERGIPEYDFIMVAAKDEADAHAQAYFKAKRMYPYAKPHVLNVVAA